MNRTRTLHEQAAEMTLDEVISDPESAALLAEWRGRFKSRDYDERYTARIGQTHWTPAAWPLEQTNAWLDVHAGIMAGLYARVQIVVGRSPGPDADRKGNASALRGIHPAFTAALDTRQRGADSDGYLTWEQPITIAKSSGEGLVTTCCTVPVDVRYVLPPGNVPLEVGYTMPSRTLAHLRHEGGVARWAYGDEVLLLLVSVEHPKWFALRKTAC